jgi:hypothetical protein
VSDHAQSIVNFFVHALYKTSPAGRSRSGHKHTRFSSAPSHIFIRHCCLCALPVACAGERELFLTRSRTRSLEQGQFGTYRLASGASHSLFRCVQLPVRRARLAENQLQSASSLPIAAHDLRRERSDWWFKCSWNLFVHNLYAHSALEFVPAGTSGTYEYRLCTTGTRVPAMSAWNLPAL